MKRIMIVGNSGSGKSSIACTLGELAGLPVVHMNKFYWKPSWELRADEEMKELVDERDDRDEWVFDGNYSKGFEKRIARTESLA